MTLPVRSSSKKRMSRNQTKTKCLNFQFASSSVKWSGDAFECPANFWALGLQTNPISQVNLLTGTKCFERKIFIPTNTQSSHSHIVAQCLVSACVKKCILYVCKQLMKWDHSCFVYTSNTATANLQSNSLCPHKWLPQVTCFLHSTHFHSKRYSGTPASRQR